MPQERHRQHGEPEHGRIDQDSLYDAEPRRWLARGKLSAVSARQSAERDHRRERRKRVDAESLPESERAEADGEERERHEHAGQHDVWRVVGKGANTSRGCISKSVGPVRPAIVYAASSTPVIRSARVRSADSRRTPTANANE